ncbi:MAG: Glycosyltransferase [Candidatus Alkanophagales archaeon MCA70_species_2]|nr:Glycosyltransferase [Candidatus Alkanophaga liquidiphilum]
MNPDLALALLGFGLAGVTTYILTHLKHLEALPSSDECEEYLRVSIVIPVRNEEDTIKECLDSIINLDYPDYEVIVVEGSSTDATRRILKRYEGRIKILDEGRLPEGWIGKNWACYKGYTVADGDLLLFTDGDTIHSTDSLRRAVCVLMREGAGLLTLMPKARVRSFWEALILPLLAFLIIVYTKAWRINRDLHDAFANGQYLLFSRGVYEAIGRHEAVRDMLVEDYALAQLVRKHGYKLRFYWAPETLKVQMYRNFTELWEGWIKNIYLGIGNPSSAALAITEIIILGVAPFIITLYGVITTNLGITLLGAPSSILMLCAGFIIQKEAGSKPLLTFLTPVAIIIVATIILVSMICYHKGVVRWKGRTYKPKVVRIR